MNLGIALVSGGLDSCVTAAIAAREVELAVLHLNYRQRTEARDLMRRVLDHHVAPRRIRSRDIIRALKTR